MKIGTIIIVAVLLTILFGAVPLMIIGNVFQVIGGFLKTVGKWLDFFGWGGVVAFQNLSQGGLYEIIKNVW